MPFGRQRTGSVVCASCGSLVGVNDERCYMCGRPNPSLWGFAPLLRRMGRDMGFVPLVMGACGLLYVATLVATVGFGQNVGVGGNPLSFLSPSTTALFLFGASGATPVFAYGRWWTVLSAGWLHAGILHIFMNMLWVRQLGPATADIYGAGRLVIIYTIAGAVGFALSSFGGYAFAGVPIPLLRGAGFTVGASAPIFGLLGALVYYGRRSGSSQVHGQAMSWALMLFVFGLIMPGVDNYAHAGGFAGGFLTGMWLDPLKPERTDHLLGAVICLALTALSIVVSIVHGLSLFR